MPLIDRSSFTWETAGHDECFFSWDHMPVNVTLRFKTSLQMWQQWGECVTNVYKVKEACMTNLRLGFPNTQPTMTGRQLDYQRSDCLRASSCLLPRTPFRLPLASCESKRRVCSQGRGLGTAMLWRVNNPLGFRPMEMQCFVLFILLCYLTARFAAAYDPMDPNGNITISWDFQSIDSTGSTYTVMVSIHNNQLYRHIEQPGWRLSWNWAGKEVIWATTGAEATEQGDCSRIGAAKPPHCCEPRPVIVDLPPGTPYNQQVANCCRGGVLSSLTQNNMTSTAAFQMTVGEFAYAKDHNGSSKGPEKPWDFNIGVPGYTCSNATEVPATRFKVDKQRHVQVLLTWQVTCSYSQYRESASPSCCVSLSAFYNSTIVACPQCSCGCQWSPPAPQCVSGSDRSTALALPHGDDEPAAPIVRCTDHMCPVRVHWHVKVNYREYWRVKVTISNYNLVRNYTDWNLVMQHPNLRSLTQLFSFNYQPLIEYGTYNDTAMFWGVKHYNEMLLQDGNVQTEMILKKNESDFTFSGGWAFPRRVYFDGHECVMPPPDQYPLLPNRASATRRSLISGPCLLLLIVFVLV
ncbi:COBRA-like protein 7 isoform X3 [Phragmites australis]|uniref:COBRA-like protein 7 isoform X3 n=1 Tax=Phragmites australis TaxID=29695 RepID=UPI002D77C216|nr:COBRA-like protein 7 isoform X3 [Phragmites australis]